MAETVRLTITMEVDPECVDLSPASGGTLLTERAHDEIVEALGIYGTELDIRGEVIR